MENFRFKELLESKLGDVRPLQEQTFPGTSRAEHMSYRDNPVDAFEEEFKKNLPYLEKSYSCLPSISTNIMGGKKIKTVGSEMRTSLFRTFFFIKKNKEKISSTFGCDEKTLLYLFKLAIAAMDQQTGLGTTYQDNEEMGRYITKADSIISNIYATFGGYQDTIVNPIMKMAKKFKGKEASVGPYQMHPSNFAQLKKTQQITGTKAGDTFKLYKDMIVSTLAVMEYFLNNYKRIKSMNNFNGSSVDYKGNVIQGMSGDYNWDVSIASYAFNFNRLLSIKYCKTNDPNWPAPCKSAPLYNPSTDTINRRKKVTGVPNPKKLPLSVFGTNIISNYFPTLTIGSDTSLIYVKWYVNYVNSKLSCFNKF